MAKKADPKNAEELAAQMELDGYTLENLPGIVPEELMARYGLSREEAQRIIDEAKPKSVKVKRIEEANKEAGEEVA